MSDITEEEMRDQVERTLAIFFTGNRMPHMSGDPRERVPPAKRRDLSDAADNVLALLQPALERARREGAFLEWVADRLTHVHGDNPNADFVHRLREIAAIRKG